MLDAMKTDLGKLPLDERIQLVEDLWDSIAADQNALPLTAEQRAELDRRLDAYEVDADPGRPAEEVIAEIRRKL
jgi:putative addiction module component (TIGR02574 family)